MRGKLYAFWVSPEESGASHGYVGGRRTGVHWADRFGGNRDWVPKTSTICRQVSSLGKPCWRVRPENAILAEIVALAINPPLPFNSASCPQIDLRARAVLAGLRESRQYARTIAFVQFDTRRFLGRYRGGSYPKRLDRPIEYY